VQTLRRLLMGWALLFIAALVLFAVYDAQRDAWSPTRKTQFKLQWYSERANFVEKVVQHKAVYIAGGALVTFLLVTGLALPKPEKEVGEQASEPTVSALKTGYWRNHRRWVALIATGGWLLLGYITWDWGAIPGGVGFGFLLLLLTPVVTWGLVELCSRLFKH
jgi:hypothetical protein